MHQLGLKAHDPFLSKISYRFGMGNLLSTTQSEGTVENKEGEEILGPSVDPPPASPWCLWPTHGWAAKRGQGGLPSWRPDMLHEVLVWLKESYKLLSSSCMGTKAGWGSLLLCHQGVLQEPVTHLGFHTILSLISWEKYQTQSLQDEIFDFPTLKMWKVIANSFSSWWDFHHACGALDGKHMASQQESKEVWQYPLSLQGVLLHCHA